MFDLRKAATEFWGDQQCVRLQVDGHLGNGHFNRLSQLQADNYASIHHSLSLYVQIWAMRCSVMREQLLLKFLGVAPEECYYRTGCYRTFDFVCRTLEPFVQGFLATF